VNDAGASITYNGSTPTSYAQIYVPYIDNGSTTVGQGTLYVPNFGPASGSPLTIGVGQHHGQLSVSGTANLNGTLAISNPSGYLPKVGAKITVISAGSRKGIFSVVTGTQLTGEHWVVSYSAKAVILTAVAG
jgi:hypothetical protein